MEPGLRDIGENSMSNSHDDSWEKFTVFWVLKVIVYPVLLVIALFATVLGLERLLGPAEHDLHYINSEYGTVQNIDYCRVGKYSYRCSVTTETGAYRFDLSDFPGETAQKGDRIFYQTQCNGRKELSYMCKNDSCRLYSVCLWWMSCMGEEK